MIIAAPNVNTGNSSMHLVYMLIYICWYIYHVEIYIYVKIYIVVLISNTKQYLEWLLDEFLKGTLPNYSKYNIKPFRLLTLKSVPNDHPNWPMDHIRYSWLFYLHDKLSFFGFQETNPSWFSFYFMCCPFDHFCFPI